LRPLNADPPAAPGLGENSVGVVVHGPANATDLDIDLEPATPLNGPGAWPPPDTLNILHSACETVCKPYDPRSYMNRNEFTQLLNEDLSTEYQSIVQYNLHISTITGPEYVSTVEELKLHLGQELSHAQVLAAQVSFLGGSPTTTVREVAKTSTSKEALTADLRLEQEQLQRYRDRFGQATELGLADVGEALRPLLEQTQEHVRDLQAALGE
jgi:bacterioferritin